MIASPLFSVANKNVLITGGSRGIGLMIAKTLRNHGANVLLTSRDAKACENAAKSILETNTNANANNDGGSTSLNNANSQQEMSILKPGKCFHVASNVSTREGCAQLAKYTSEIFDGKLDVLINNAGCSWGEEVYERESGRMNWGWDKVLDLNVKGMFYLTRECVPLLQRLDNNEKRVVDDPGRVINIGSVAGIVNMETPTHAYDVSKAAVHHLTKKMASDLAKKGITVNAIAPGFVATKMSDGLEKWSEEDGGSKLEDRIPLGRLGTEEDMAGSCIYLCSRAGSWCTGVVLNVDGGTVGCLQIPISSNL